MGDSVPQTPWDLPLSGPKHEKEGQCVTHCPHASVTNYGAQVASQQSLILRVGKQRISRLHKKAIGGNKIRCNGIAYEVEKIRIYTLPLVTLLVRQRTWAGYDLLMRQYGRTR